MKVKVFNTLEELGDFAAQEVLSVIETKPKSVIGLATGSSPVPIYKSWGRLAKEQNIDVTAIECFALDEYVGLDEEHPESYHRVIAEDATAVIGLNPALVHVPSGQGDVPGNAIAYDSAIRDAGGIDLQILGIGRNGHIAFNEPGSTPESRTRQVDLMPETISDNARFFNSVTEVPTKAITQGIGTILEAKKLIVVATGEAKAPAVAAAIQGEEDINTPASFLRRHPDVTWCLDKEAAALLD